MLQAILCCEFQSRPQNKCVPTKLYLFIKYTILLQIIFTVFKTQSTKGNFVTITKFTINIKNMYLSLIFNPCPERRKSCTSRGNHLSANIGFYYWDNFSAAISSYTLSVTLTCFLILGTAFFLICAVPLNQKNNLLDQNPKYTLLTFPMQV
jgi:hypothetical protein